MEEMLLNQIRKQDKPVDEFMTESSRDPRRAQQCNEDWSRSSEIINKNKEQREIAEERAARMREGTFDKYYR